MRMEWVIDGLERVFGTADPISADEVASASARVGVRFPPALELLYLRTGKSGPLHACSRLVELDELNVEDGHLVFYIESQDSCRWGIDVQWINEEDPPVSTRFVGVDGAYVSGEEFDSLSDFLCMQAPWQAVQGGLPVAAKFRSPGVPGSADPDPLIRRVRGRAAEVGMQLLESGDRGVWIVGAAIFAFWSRREFVAAARDERSFRDACARVGMRMEDWLHIKLPGPSPGG